MSTKSSGKRRLAVVVLWIVSIGIVAGGIVIWKVFSKGKLEEETGSESQYKYQVDGIGDPFSGWCFLRSDAMKSELKRDKIKLNLIPDEPDPVARLKALQDGKADFAAFTIDSYLSAHKVLDIDLLEDPGPGTIVLVVDETKGADAIVSWDNIVTIEDLDDPDAQIVATPFTPSEFISRIAIDSFNLPSLPEKWMIEADGAGDAYAQFRKDKGKKKRAYALWEPYVSKAIKDGGHVLLGSDKLKGYIVDVLVMRREFVKDSPDLAKKIVEAYLRVAHSYTQGKDLNALILKDAKSVGESLDMDDAKKLVEGILWKNTLENYAHFNLLGRQESGGLENMEDMILKVAKVLVATGVYKEDFLDLEASGLFYDGILSDLQSSDFHPGKKLNIIAGAGPDLDAVRKAKILPELDEKQWNKLIPVGTMKIRQLSFKRSTAELSPQSKRNLTDLTTKLKSMPDYYLLVTGHSRSDGDIEENKKLAEMRAKVVSEHLILRLGLSRNRIKAIAAPPSNEGGSVQSVRFQILESSY